METSPFFETSTSLEQADVLRKLEKVAGEHGFGIIAVHDMQATYRKAGHTFPPCAIVELCRPAESFEALSKDIRMGHMVPKAILVFRDEEQGRTVLSVMKNDIEKLAEIFPRVNIKSLSPMIMQELQEVMEETVAEKK